MGKVVPAGQLQYLIARQNQLGHEVHDPLNGRYGDPDCIRRLILAGCLLGFLTLLLTPLRLSRLRFFRLPQGIGAVVKLGEFGRFQVFEIRERQRLRALKRLRLRR